METNNAVGKQISVPELFEGVSKWGTSNLDHSWHEMADLRPATLNEINEITCYGTLIKLVGAFKSTSLTRCSNAIP